LNISALILQRIAILFAPYHIDLDHDIHLVDAIKVLKSLKPGDSIRIIKTWLNGWTTTERMHEECKYPCLFGCKDGKDNLQHYILCPHLFALNSFLMPCTSNLPLVRLGLVHPTQTTQLALCCTFAGYHAVKNSIFELHESKLTNAQIRANWTLFAEAFKAEAGVADLQCRAYSVHQFISFLVNKSSTPQAALVDSPLQPNLMQNLMLEPDPRP